jgi:feruloyl esterase
MRRFSSLSSLLGLMIFAAAYADRTAAADAAAACAALRSKSIAIEDTAPLAIASTRFVNATNDLPEHCAISGFIAPQVGFEIRLPTTAWNGLYLQQGCRGLCGFMPTDTTNDALARGYAVGTTDMGHKAASSQSGIWALAGDATKRDFGYRATHVTAVAARELVKGFYGRTAEKRLFRGCGTGGRQGLLAAQRYPRDFDGIIANGGIVFNFTKLNYLMVWSVRANRDGRGKQILKSADLKLLHDAVMNACDANDGMIDNVIGDPQACRFEPSSLLCKNDAQKKCLTTEQVGAAKKMYAGPMTSNGENIYPGMAFGSELRWESAFFGDDPRYGKFATEIFSYFLPDNGTSNDFRIEDFDLNTPVAAYRNTEALVNAESTDYQAFRSQGGKILAIHGWNESAMPGAFVTKYYDRLVKDVGSIEKTRDFFRLYMVPGDMHCTSGIPEGRHFDSLTIMETWLKQGRAPALIEGHEVRVEPKLPDQVRFPIDPKNVSTTRPFLPYPERLRLKPGSDPKQIDSYQIIQKN